MHDEGLAEILTSGLILACICHIASKTISETEREGTCFFWPYMPNMLFPAARELQKREQEYQQLKHSNLYTRIALWIAAAGLLMNAFVELLRLWGGGKHP